MFSAPRQLMLRACIVGSLLLQLASCWSCPGHMVTAHIAARLIGAEKVAFFKPYVSSIASNYPNVSTMTEAACWADDIKGDGIKQYSDWHFIDNCFSIDGTPCPSVDNQNGYLLEKLPQLVYNMTHDSDMTTLSFSFDFIVHLMGDLHQPLHVVSEYSRQFLHGDQGGNRFHIEYHPNTSTEIGFSHALNLHAYCDAVAEDSEFHMYRPINADNLSKMDQLTSELLLIPVDDDEVSYTDSSSFESWANSTYLVAQHSIYLNGNLQPGAHLTNDYVTSTREVLRRQVMLGGRRLASVLEFIYNEMKSNSQNLRLA